jgi:hypothetical protein
MQRRKCWSRSKHKGNFDSRFPENLTRPPQSGNAVHPAGFPARRIQLSTVNIHRRPQNQRPAVLTLFYRDKDKRPTIPPAIDPAAYPIRALAITDALVTTSPMEETTSVPAMHPTMAPAILIFHHGSGGGGGGCL